MKKSINQIKKNSNGDAGASYIYDKANGKSYHIFTRPPQ